MSAVRSEEDAVGAWPVIFGLYWAGLAAWRSFEVLALPRDAVVLDPFPAWLVTYLIALVVWLFVNGALWLVCALLLRRGRAVPRLGVAALVSSIGLVLVHGWFTLTHEAAIGEGGALWGAIHLWTLTRTTIPHGASAAGALGFHIGQGVGLVAWLIAALAAGAEVLRPRFAGPPPANH